MGFMRVIIVWGKDMNFKNKLCMRGLLIKDQEYLPSPAHIASRVIYDRGVFDFGRNKNWSTLNSNKM